MRELTELKGEPLGFGGHVQFQTATGKESRIEKAINITDECTKVPKVFKVHIFYIRTEKEGMGGLIVEIPPDGVPDTFVGFCLNKLDSTQQRMIAHQAKILGIPVQRLFEILKGQAPE